MNSKEKNYIIYTAGSMGITIKRYAEALKMNVVAFYDNNQDLQGKIVDGLKVYTAEELKNFIHDSDRNEIIIGNELYKNEIRQELTEKFGTHAIINAEIIQNKYWDEIVPIIKTQWKNEYYVSYNEEVKVWLENIMSEVEFWVTKCASSKGIYYKDYCNRINISNTAFECRRLERNVAPNSIVVDAGCGICSQYGTVVEGGKIQLLSIDPLAYFYNTINKKSIGIKEEMIQFGMFEFLSLFLGKGIADVVLIDNAIDHCIDPFKSIIESLATLKIGGILSMRHRRCEAIYEGYSGLHKWNVDVNNQNELILWNKSNMKNVNKTLADLAEIKVILHESGNRSNEFIDVNIIKKKEIDTNRFYNHEEECVKLAQVIDRIMKLFSSESINSQFAKLLKGL